MYPRHDEGPVSRTHTLDDISGFGRNEPRGQGDVLRTVRHARTAAARGAKLDRNGAFEQEFGDGELARWPAQVSSLDLLDRYPPALATELSRGNERRIEEAWIRMRLAVVDDLSAVEGTSLTGNAAVTLRRLVDAPQCRRALELLPGRPLVVVIDHQLYQRLVEPRYGSLDPSQYIPFRVDDPQKRFRADAWLTVPGCDATERELLRQRLAEPAHGTFEGTGSGSDSGSGTWPGSGAGSGSGSGLATGAGTAAGDAGPSAAGPSAAARGGGGGAGQPVAPDAHGTPQTEPDAPDDRPWWRNPVTATIVAAAIAALATVVAALVPVLLPTDDEPGEREPSLSVTGTCTRQGDQLTVSSSGFTPNGPYTVSAVGPGGEPYPLSNGSSGTATAAGALRTRWMCEAQDEAGDYTMTATDTTTGRSARTTFHVDKVT
ncbi:hypothetical protein ABZ519_12985 [Streptomyces collinus]|uniref:hypothetical protein n=1 Tax=Streptomyces collinus TaxID=42684 RepID=UPI003402053F